MVRPPLGTPALVIPADSSVFIVAIPADFGQRTRLQHPHRLPSPTHQRTDPLVRGGSDDRHRAPPLCGDQTRRDFLDERILGDDPLRRRSGFRGGCGVDLRLQAVTVVGT